MTKLINSQTKVCAKCKEEKHNSAFTNRGKHERSKTGLSSWCKECKNAVVNEKRDQRRKDRNKLISIDGEQWKEIPGYEGRYMCSTFGRIYSIERKENVFEKGAWVIKTIPGGMMKPHTADGSEWLYNSVCLTMDGVQKRFMVHRLVAECFIPNPDNKPQVNHVDGNKLNNILENLEWVTLSENVHHALQTGLSKQKGATHDNAKKVVNTDTGEVFGSIMIAAEKNNIHYGYLKSMLNGRNKNTTPLRKIS